MFQFTKRTCFPVIMALVVSQCLAQDSASPATSSERVTSLLEYLKEHVQEYPTLLQGLVGCWGGHGAANDSVGGNDGHRVGGVIYWRAKFGNGFLLDGKSSAIVIPDAEALKFSHSLT